MGKENGRDWDKLEAWLLIELIQYINGPERNVDVSSAWKCARWLVAIHAEGR
jgi:hypothetical protein